MPTPPVVVHTPQGDVRAYSDEDAQRIAGLLVELAPKVRAVLVEGRDGGPEVIMLDSDLGLGDACNYDGRVIITPGARALERFLLAHELVHWQIAGAWKALPHTAQEGLADRIAFDLCPDLQLPRGVQLLFALHRGVVRDPVEALSLTDRNWSDMRDENRKAGLYALGFFVVSRIGIEPLRTLCSEAQANSVARIPARRLLEQARLSATDVWDWSIDMKMLLPPGARSVSLTAELGFGALEPDQTSVNR